MTAVESQVEQIEHLDFDVTCERSTCDKPGDWVIRCRSCAMGFIWCDKHLTQAIAIVDNSEHMIVCIRCGARGNTHAEMFEVLPARVGKA